MAIFRNLVDGRLTWPRCATCKIGNILVGFGILFSGLMNMTSAVDALTETGVFNMLFSQLSNNPLVGYLTGATVAFILQSSSAAVGILQAFSASGHLTFSAIYSVIVGIYLGDCVTTAIVCSIGAQADARRVGIVNILFNLLKSALVLIVVTILHKAGLLDWLWNHPVNPGSIANTNSLFNLGCALCLFPFLTLLEKASLKIVKDKPEPVRENKYKDKLEALNPNFFSTPAIALRSCYDLLRTMLDVAESNIDLSFELLKKFDEKKFAHLNEEEDNLDLMTDHLSNYLAALSGTLKTDEHVQIMNEYYKIVTEVERLGDYAMNLGETGRELDDKNISFSDTAAHELDVLHDLISRILMNTEQAFVRRDFKAARSVEPLEEVVDDMVETLKTNHLSRLASGVCNVYAGSNFIDTLGNIERISDVCSNIALATLARVKPELAQDIHSYIGLLHSGADETFNEQYRSAKEEYFSRLNKLIDEQAKQDSLAVKEA